MRIGAPEETIAGERRVAVTPSSVKKLRELGHEVVIEHGAGHHSGIEDEEYASAGAELVSRADAFAAEVVLKVRPPKLEEIERMREGAILVSLLQLERNPELESALNAKKVSAIALERVPRISRAQKMDVLSSMANAAGYRAVIAAAEHYQGFFGAQVTAAGSMPPIKVLVIGAGVAGLAAIAAAKALGAEVRAFDTRAAAREQVESLGATFLVVDFTESGEGQGGYAKEMSKEFIEAEMRLFKKQAEEVSVVITTALVPGRKAPTLLPRDVAEALKPGSVIVDMAAEQGGNCELTVPGEVIVHQGITVVGWTDLPSRMARATSKFFAANVAALVAEMGSGAAFQIDLESEVIRPALVLHRGETLPPLPRKEPSPQDAPKRSTRPPPADAKPKQAQITSPTRRAWGTTLAGMILIAALFALGRFAPGDFLQHFTVFILACFVGWQVIWSVSPALHTPLMSVTNAISGIIVVGGMLQIRSEIDLSSILGALAVLFAAINVAGGFLVTQRMLRMFRRDGPSSGESGATDEARRMNEGVVTIAYLIAGVLFIRSLGGLSKQETAGLGNLFGMVGMAIAVVVTAVVWSGGGGTTLTVGPLGLGLLAGAVALGSVIGAYLAQRVEMTGMPELVAILHSFVGLAAVLVGIASYVTPEVAVPESGIGAMFVDAPTRGERAVHLIEIGIGVAVGAVTFTGSIVAWAKLRGSISGKPLLLPGRHLLNAVVALAIVGSLVPILSASDPWDGLPWLLGMTALSSLLGVHLVMAIGGADMPVVVSLLNSYSGWAAAAAGFVLANDLLIVTGALVGASGTILSIIMCRAMNRSILNVVFGGFGTEGGAPASGEAPTGEMREITNDEVAERLRTAKEVVVVPGYGMAVARAQGPVNEMCRALRDRGARVRFAIHPVAGRLPGHMNVLLAEAGVPYDLVLEMEHINQDFEKTDVVLVIGANDIVNPGALDDASSPIYGMPVLEVWKSKLVVVSKRGKGAGYAGIENPLFFLPCTRMLYGDARKSMEALVAAVRKG